jgi:protein TonB
VATGPYSEGDVDERPRLVRDVQPAYPADALRLGVEGDVVLTLVVDAAGRVTDARVTRSAGHGFDESALRVARMLRFTPGCKRGAAVPVRITWTCRFRLEE